jgi:hypothetical protein
MTATGRSPAAPTSAADSMSAARYPSAASALRSAALTIFGTVTILPARAGSPARRSSAASRSAPGSGTVLPPSDTSVATTRSPGLRSSASPAAVPITTIAPNGPGLLSPRTLFLDRAPMPVRWTRLDAARRPRRTAFASRRSGASTSSPPSAAADSGSAKSASSVALDCGMVSVMS